MALVAKSEQDGVNNTPHPPGYHYVGNPSYGRWTDRGGTSFWEFYGQYALMSHLLGWGGGFGMSRYDYDDYRSYRRDQRPYYGRNREYVTQGSVTQKQKPSTFQRRQANIAQKKTIVHTKSAKSHEPESDRLWKLAFNKSQPIWIWQPQFWRVWKMIGQDLIATGIYLISAFILFWLGKLVKDLTTTSYSVREELVEKDNVALGVAMAGYYFGLIMAIGGTLSGPSQGLENDLIDIGIYGLLAIILLNLSRLVNDGVILHGFKIRDELIDDQNAGTGAVIAASYIATGLVIFGAVSGEIGGIVTTVIFWALGQVALVLAGLVYELITPYSIHDEIEKDNVAAGVAFAARWSALASSYFTHRRAILSPGL